MKKEIITCDILNCENTGAKNTTLQVIFLTEQTEGRGTEPYLEMVTIDLCDECLKKILKQGRYIHAIGAQGNNEYYFI